MVPTPLPLDVDLEGLTRPLLVAPATIAGLESTCLTVFHWDRREQEVRFVHRRGAEIEEGSRLPLPPEVSKESLPASPDHRRKCRGPRRPTWSVDLQMRADPTALLHIVRNLVEAMGGKVTAEANPWRGSTFTVRFPHRADLSAYPSVSVTESRTTA